MQPERQDLEALFAPAPGQYGTHLLLCGLSADTETLERIVSAFTGEHKVQRAAAGLLRSVLMLDASAPLLGPLDVPGMLQLAPSPVASWTTKTSLLHAKVALMGFADTPFAAPAAWRLIISTGNWTRETWGNGSQIDLFWSTAWTQGEPGEAASTAQADIQSALNFFHRIMDSLYADSYRFLRGQELALDWLQGWHDIVRATPSSKRPHFIHSLDQSLFRQIKSRFPKSGIATLVAGSGFFEKTAADPAAKPEVLARLEELADPGTRYLVFNGNQAGALAGWIAANPKKARQGKLGEWTFCQPADPLASKPGLGRSCLHAKYIAGLRRVAHSRNATGTLGALYLGSGNLSRAGLLSSATLAPEMPGKNAPGNVEAGVFVDEETAIPQVWQALACGDLQSADQIAAIEAGGGEPILVPRDPPPVLFARVSRSQMELVRSAAPPTALQLRTSSVADWIDIGATQQAIAFHSPAVPPIVWIRSPGTADQDTGAIHEIPVLSAEGLLCRQAPPQVPVDDILESLLAFPQAPLHLPDPDPPAGRGSHGHATTPSVSASRYPLRVLAALIEAIGQRNAILTREQFPVWLSQLRLLLLEQTLEADRTAIRAAGIDLFGALTCPGFKPAWLDDAPALRQSYETLVAEIQQAWCTPDAACPMPVLQQLASGEECEENP